MKSIFYTPEVSKVSPKVGDILVSTWGYDQTNADFYKVLKVSKAMVTITRLESNEVSEKGNWMFGKATAMVNNERGPVENRRFKSSADSYYIKINSYSSAHPWDGTPVAVSHTH